MLSFLHQENQYQAMLSIKKPSSYPHNHIYKWHYVSMPFLKWWVSPTNPWVFLLKLISTGVEIGVPPFFRKHPGANITPLPGHEGLLQSWHLVTLWAKSGKPGVLDRGIQGKGKKPQWNAMFFVRLFVGLTCNPIYKAQSMKIVCIFWWFISYPVIPLMVQKSCTTWDV